MISRERLPGLVRFIYTHNPFYLISAGLMLYGIYVAFGSKDAKVDDPWLLIMSLCGYTALMAVAAFLVIKLGRVWEDARSIVLILLLQFAALSMSFDEICAVSSGTAFRLLLFGFCFSALVSEGLLSGLGIRFPALFRTPYYLILGLFFFYPLCLSPKLTEASVAAITWRIYLFPALAGLAFLTLIPALRRGAAFVAKNGTPWPWPWFPWTAFGFLAFAVGVRSYVLSQSFNIMGLQNGFGAYYLVPFLFALLLLLLELSVVQRWRGLQVMLMGLAPVLLVLSIPMGDNYVYRRFLDMLQQTAGSPVWLALLGLVAFYGYSWYRRLLGAELGLVAMLALLIIVDRQTVGLETLSTLNWWPLATIGGLQLVLAANGGGSRRCAASCLCLIGASTIAWHDTQFTALGGVFPFHLLMAGVLVTGWIYRDRFAAFLRKAGIALAAFGVTVAIASIGFVEISELARLGYLLAMTIIAGIYWWLVTEKWWLYAALAHAVVTWFAGLWASYGVLNTQLGSDSLTPLALGAASFVIATAISAIKGGLVKRLQDRLTTCRVLQR